MAASNPRERTLEAVKPIAPRAARRLDAREERAVAEAYVEGADSTSLAEAYGVSRYAILRSLRCQGIPRRCHTLRRRVYRVRDDAFSQIDDEAAYWAGFITADGHIPTQSAIEVGVQARDRAQIEKFARFLSCPELPIRAGGAAGVYACVRSEQLVADLARHDVLRAKRGAGPVASKLAETTAFWLGFCDGDGTIYWSGRRLAVHVVQGTQPILDQFAEHVGRVCNGAAPRVARTTGGHFRVSVYGGRARLLLAHWYAMPRPYALARKQVTAYHALAGWHSTLG